MTEGWTIAGLLHDIGTRGRHPAVIVSTAEHVDVWDSATLAGRALALARGLRTRGIARAVPVALWAPNSPVWIASALGVLAAGGVLVPVDDLADEAQFEAALASSGAKLLVTSAEHAAAHQATLAVHGIEMVLLDTQDGRVGAPGWESLLRDEGDDPPAPDDETPATLFWTSGTTGSPKAFYLTHRNIAANVEAVHKLGVVGLMDRALLPLPLHHAYPFVVGMLSSLTIGAAIILPGSATGPQIMKALRDGNATTIVGVPRLYEAFVTAIDSRIGARGVIARIGWRGLLRLAVAVQRMMGLRIGRVLFAPVRHGVGRHLRNLISGGARLDQETAETLEALGWTVLTGYGLAETASLFTGSRPSARRAGSAGQPIADGRVRIAHPDEQGIGEIELRGSSITAGYLNNPAANQSTFTEDGWFRTGDLGWVDRDGYLFVTGRAKEILVLGGGKKIFPEDLEKIYASAPQIREIAVLEDQGALVALVRPDPVKVREMGATNLRDGIRIVLAEHAQDLPSYQRLSGFALTDQPFPRTRLGKFRRFLLHEMYAQARMGTAQRAPHALSAEDEALLRDPTATAVWNFLRGRYPGRITDLDVNFGLDLNLDSFAWMELSVALEDTIGVHLSEAEIARIETIRDLLRLAPERRAEAAAARTGAPAIALDIDRWLAPTGWLLTFFGIFLYGLNWLVMRGLFRLRVTGLEHLPRAGSFVITPNHVSDLDAMAIAAALPLSRLRHVYWAGDIVRLFYNRLSSMVCRAVHLFPVDEAHPSAAVETASRVLRAGNSQVWFPEGWRSPDGQLQRFLPGIGQLLLRSGAPAVPAWIEGAFEALPRGHRIPRFRQVTLVFGPPQTVPQLLAAGGGRSDEERVASALRERVEALSPAAAAHANQGTPPPA